MINVLDPDADKEVIDVEQPGLEPEMGAEVEPVQISEEEKKRLDELAAIKLNALGQSLAKTRAEAISARLASGIEEEWFEDEEFYQGIDDANRAESKTVWRSKPMGQAKAQSPVTTRSTVFPNITGPYVDAAAARIADMLLPTDDRAWALTPTPIPELLNTSKGKHSPQMLKEAAVANPGNPKMAQQQLAVAVAEADKAIAEAKEKADKAQKRIEDWHVECQFHAAVRLVIEDSARIGTGVLKGPVPVMKRRRAWINGKVELKNDIKPASKWIDPWNFYPDGACGDNIHNGSYTWERDYLTKKQLRDLKGQPDYIDSQIALCLEEGASRATAAYKEKPDPVSDEQEKNKYEVWYFHGTAEREDLEAAGCDCDGYPDPHLPAMIVMVNNRVIKAVLNPLDTGDFPYDVMVWRRRSGHWTGIGVARQIRTPQRVVTAATRNLMDNAGIAAGPMLVFRNGVVTPADGIAGIAPRKIWYISEDAENLQDARMAIGVVKVDMLVAELMEIIQLGLKLAEDVTGLPMLLQGQQGKAPDTVGGMQILNNNASSVLRRLARLFDDRITEPHVRRYYEWLLDYGDDEEKGDYVIDARGSSALVERDLQNQAVLQMGSMVLDPRFGVDPKKWFEEYCKSQRLDNKRFHYDDDEWQKIVENMSKGPEDPRVAIAQMREKSAERAREVDVAMQAMDQKFEALERQRDRELEMALKGVDAELTAREQTGQKEISLADIKAMLAGKFMGINAENNRFDRELAVKKTTGQGI